MSTVPCLSACSAATTASHTPPLFTHSLEGLISPQMARGQVPYTYKEREVVTYRQKPAVSEGFRRHSTDGVIVAQELGQGAEERRFHPYCRQYSEGSPVNCPPLCSSPFTCLQEMEMPKTSNAVTPPAGHHEGERDSWPPYTLSPHASMFMDTAENPPSYPFQTQGGYVSTGPLQQFPDVFTSGEQTPSPHYAFDRVSSKTTQPEYPKPIYSYSILIFMALRSSKTGSLPVSEIYSFMTDHFPYFKTAPDGWKNSVRHNLSLNKCFEKVDNKSGSASRKGCLWALNPSKVEKMQEELQKWRRKDPLTTRKSMARPDELDHLLEDRPDKMKSTSARLNHRQTYQTMRMQGYDPVSPYAPPQPREHNPQSHRQPLYNYPLPAASQRPPYLFHSPTAFPFQCPVTQQPGTNLPPNTGALESPLPAQTPPSYTAALQATRGISRSIQELLLEGDLNTDVDTLNPSLTDLQLQGHLWEELKDDSLALDSVTTTAVPTSASLSSPRQRGESLWSLSSAGTDVVGPSAGERHPGRQLDLNVTSHYSSTFANVDSMSTYQPTTGNSSIPLV